MPDIYLLIEGKQEGPYNKEQVQQSLSEGLIPSDLPAWHEGLDDWVAVASLVDSDQTIPAELLVEDHGTSDLAPSFSESEASPTPSPLKTRWYMILIYVVGGLIIFAGLTIGAIRFAGYFHRSVGATLEQVADGSGSAATPSPANTLAQTDVGDGNPRTDANGSSTAATPADIEEARAFIEKKLGQAWGYSTQKWIATVKLDSATGHIEIDFNGHYECLLSSLDPDSIVEKKDANDDDLVIYTRDHARVVTVNHGGGQDEVTDRIELLNAPDKDRLAKAFAFLINAFPPDSSATVSESGDLRDKLCQEMRSSLSADDSLLKSEVSYDKSTETLTAECFGRFNDMYGKLVIPIKQIDPQEIKWTQSGMNKSQMLLVTLDKQRVIEVTHRSAFNQGTPFKVGSYEDLYFPTENDAAEFADTLTQLCKELGWQPSKF